MKFPIVTYDKETMRVPIKSWCDNVDDGAMEQAMHLACHPVIFKQVNLMADVGKGYGMPIGCVIACEDAIIPNAVGKDISCGMRIVKTSLHYKSFYNPSTLPKILNLIEKLVPHGEGKWHKKPQKNNLVLPSVIYKVTKQQEKNLDLQIGTLGGGNHFIEIQVGDDDHIYFMIHCGSRNFGSKVCNYYNNEAKKLNRRWHSEVDEKWDLAFLPIGSYEAKSYIEEMKVAMAFSFENRRLISERVKEAFTDVIDCGFYKDLDVNHNYAIMEHHFGKNVWVHRKGAICARKGTKGVIPGSMGTPSYIVEGLGNPNSFNSCSHGAGRSMSRTEASKKLKIDDCNKSMEGIHFKGWNKTNRKGKIDLSEAPDAYKDIDKVMKTQKDLVKTIVKLKPLGVVKG